MSSPFLLRVLALGLSVGLMLGAQEARAGHSTSALTSHASVANSCVIVSAQSISFGAYNPTSAAPTQGSGQISLKCTKGDAVSVVPVSGGAALMGGQGSLRYGLYTNTGLTTTWGTGSTYAQINFGSNIYFNHMVTLGAGNQSQCATLASGGLYIWNPTSNGLCWYGWSASTTSTYANGLNVAANTLYVGGVYVAGGRNGNYIYAPTGSTQVGTTGYVYNTVVAYGAGATLSGSSAGASQPLVFTYYANVPGAQDVPAGAYTDTVVVQVTF